MSAPRERPRSRKVLVIDDCEIARETIREALETDLVAVVTHDSPIGSGAIILREQPDVVLLDLEMPGMQGDVLLRLCRERGLDRQTRFVFWSAMPEAELARRTSSAGAVGYVCKGDARAVARALRRWLT